MTIKSYIVKPADGFIKIAKALGSSAPSADAEYLARANGMVITASIHPGLILWYDDTEIDQAPAEPPLTLGFASYTAADAARWTTAHPEYQRLSSSWGGRLSRGDEPTSQVPTTVPGHQTVPGYAMIEAAIWAKAQSLLWRADRNVTRQQKAHAKIDGFVAMSRATIPAENDWRLTMSWAVSNLVQAAWISEYPKAKLEPFLRWVIPHMDWWAANNWNATFAAVRAMTAGYLGDPTMLADAVQYVEYHLPRTIYHLTYDKGVVVPLFGFANPNNPATMWPGKKADTIPDYLATWDNWSNDSNSASQLSQTNSVAPSQMVTGANCEDMRDLSHVSMALKSWLDAALAIYANGGRLSQPALDRLVPFVGRHSKRTLDWFATGNVTSWPPTQQGGEGLKGGWWTARKFLKVIGKPEPASLTQLLARVEVTGFAATGALQLSAEAFAEGTFAAAA